MFSPASLQFGFLIRTQLQLRFSLLVYGSNNFAKRDLTRNLLDDRAEQKFSGEFRIPKSLRRPNIPVLMSPCHSTSPPGDRRSGLRSTSPRLFVSGYAARRGRW